MKVRTFYRFAYLLLAIMAIGFFTSSNAQDPGVRGMGGVGITVFRDRDFQGSAATYTYNVPNLARTGFNNMISSVRVGPGERWDTNIKVDRPGLWAFHCHILPHVEGADGMFGMVNLLLVVPTAADVDTIVQALLA